MSQSEYKISVELNGEAGSIHHMNAVYLTWEWFTFILRVYTSLISVFDVAFLFGKKHESTIFFFVDFFIIFMFVIDTALKLLVVYRDDDTNANRSNYLEYLIFALDVVFTIVEFERIILDLEEGYVGWLRLFCIYRLLGAFVLLNRIEKNPRFWYVFVRSLKITLVYMFTAHTAACIFYYMGVKNKNIENTWLGLSLDSSMYDSYVSALYWSISTVTTTGYGDVHPVNSGEKIFVSSYILGNVVLCAYVVGSISNLVMHTASKTQERINIWHEVSIFARKNKLTDDLNSDIIDHMKLYFANQCTVHQKVTDLIPKSIFSEVACALFGPLLQNAPMFANVSAAFRAQLALEVRYEYYNARKNVIIKNQASTDFYIIASGVVNLIRDGATIVGQGLRPGAVFGEVGVLFNIPQRDTYQTDVTSCLLRVNKIAFMEVVRANLGEGSIIMDNLFQQYREDTHMQGFITPTRNKIAFGLLDFPLSVVFAAKVENLILVTRLLEQHMDVNEVDDSGRTALHYATSFGNYEIASLLLDNGANPLIIDLQRSVPIWECIKSDYTQIQDLLLQHGASLSTHRDVGDFACYAVDKRNNGWLSGIIKFGGDVGIPSRTGTTALHKAMTLKDPIIARTLIVGGADVYYTDISGSTPLDLTLHEGMEEMFHVIFDTSIAFISYLNHANVDDPAANDDDPAAQT